MEKVVMLPKEKQSELHTYMPDNHFLTSLADFFSVFSDMTRVKIITALCLNEMCVGDLALLLGINQTTVSHQLKLLKACNVVCCKRVGKLIFYKIASDDINSVMSCGVDYLIEN